jgi:signal transduction histidine kinase
MTPPAPFTPEMVELNALLREIWDQTMPACEAKGIEFIFVPSPAPVFTAADGPLLMRAIHNLLSNSMKFSPGQTLTLELRRKGSRLHILYTDPGALMPPDPFTRYLRDPGLEDPRLGLGMGLKLVTTAAVAHQGCAFLVPRKTGGVTTVLDLPIRQDTPLRSNRHRISYTGERDALLVELSDVLPPEFYK